MNNEKRCPIQLRNIFRFSCHSMKTETYGGVSIHPACLELYDELENPNRRDHFLLDWQR